MNDTLSRIDALIGEEKRALLVAACRDEEDLLKCAKLMLDYGVRENSPNLKDNLLITMVKVAIQSQNLPPSKMHNAAQTLIKGLGLSIEDRRFMYECLFDEAGLEGPGLRLYRRQ